MRTPPAWRMAARSISRKAPKPFCRRPCGEKAARPQFWPVGAQQVGRRADGQADQGLVLPAPAMAAAGIGADGEVGDQADRHAGVARARACAAARLLVGAELHVGVQRDLVGVGARRMWRRRGCAGSRSSSGQSRQCQWPARELLGVQRLEAGVGLQRLALLACGTPPALRARPEWRRRRRRAARRGGGGRRWASRPAVRPRAVRFPRPAASRARRAARSA